MFIFILLVIYAIKFTIKIDSIKYNNVQAFQKKEFAMNTDLQMVINIVMIVHVKNLEIVLTILILNLKNILKDGSILMVELLQNRLCTCAYKISILEGKKKEFLFEIIEQIKKDLLVYYDK
ncbi:unnamed protein product [Paramecium sonneborni]|uniref:Uncharacterized protein n=1 Tax=Paramecium sonneborni TaxID=65129 RepID=A0A8S1LX37_9CILI|nr:unnamed protein product [Paramecium sonneborni]